MTRGFAILVLTAAALLEAGGDALVRVGLRTPGLWARAAWFAAAAVMLFAYGWTVNAPRWDFGRLLGIYVVLFFLTAQLISWIAFGEAPSKAILVGGALIVSGGLVVAWGS